MSIHKSLSFKEIGRGGGATSPAEGDQRSLYKHHHTQILLEESMMRFLSNNFFFFAGTNAAAMFWISRELFMVVLVLCTQPREGNSNPNIATEENQKFLMSLKVFSKSKVTTGALKPRMSNRNGLPDLGYVSSRGYTY